MPGFMSSASAMTVCQFEKPAPLSAETLRQNAFSDTPDAEDKKSGWVGMGKLLDTQNFFLASADARFSGFSHRLDARKPSGAVIKLKLAEKIRDEEAAGAPVSAKRKKELREAITSALTTQADYAPTLTDCVWDAEKGRLFVATTSDQILERVLAAFGGMMKQNGAPIEPEKYMADVFSQIQKNDGTRLGDLSLQPLGDASLSSEAGASEKSAVSVQNNPAAVSEALEKGLAIHKMSLVATKDNSDEELVFTLDDSLKIPRLNLPKAEKGAEEEATFLINAEICARVADIIESLSRE